MPKKVCVIGSGMDVTSKPRGDFIDSYFDEVYIIKYSINFLEEFKEYIGTPTVLISPNIEWYKYDYKYKLDKEFHTNWDNWFNETDQEAARQRIYNNLRKSKIRRVIFDGSLKDQTSLYYHPFIDIKNSLGDDINIEYKINIIDGFTTGLSTILELIQEGNDVYYFGFDSFTKGYHYYSHLENTRIPYKSNITKHDMRQYKKIKELEASNKLKHIDNIPGFLLA